MAPYKVDLSNIQIKGITGKPTNIVLMDLHLTQNKRFKSLFDFGGDHVFNIKVTKFAKPKRYLYPSILA